MTTAELVHRAQPEDTRPSLIRITGNRGLGPLLRLLRRTARLSQAELGKRIHLTGNGVSKREIGDRATTVAALVETANAAGYDLVLVARDRRGARS